MKFQFNDGGRKESGYQGSAGDCVCRAIAIVSGKPYQEVYDALTSLMKQDRKSKARGKTTPRDGVFKKVYHDYLLANGFSWTPTMFIGSGCKVHLREGEVPMGRIIVRASKHLTSVIDGVINDTFDPSRKGTRCVYGYYQEEVN